MDNDLSNIGQALLDTIAVGRVNRSIDERSLPRLEVRIWRAAQTNQALQAPKEKSLRYGVTRGINPIRSAGLSAYRKGLFWSRIHRAHLSIPKNRLERMPHSLCVDSSNRPP